MSADLDLPALQRVVAEAPPCTLVATCDDAHYPDACWYARIRLEHARGLTVATLQPDWCEGPDGTRHELTRAQAQALATYIATFDPATVGALLGEVERLAAIVERLEQEISDGNAALGRAGVGAADGESLAAGVTFLVNRHAEEANRHVEIIHDAVAERESLKEKYEAQAKELADLRRRDAIVQTYIDELGDVDTTDDGRLRANHWTALEGELGERSQHDQRMTTTNKYLAPAGHIFMCAACGKWGKDRMRIGDESCFIRAILLVGDEPRFDFIADEAGILQCTVVNEVVESQP